MVLAHPASAFWHHFHPWITKKMTWKLSPTLTSQITENHAIVPKVGPRRLPKCTLKSIKIDIWPSVCPLGVPLDPMITKIVPQVSKIMREGLQNDSFRYKNQPFQQPTSQQLPASKGAGGRGEALKFGAPLAGGAAGRDGIATEKKLQEGFRWAPPLPPAPPVHLGFSARKS